MGLPNQTSSGPKRRGEGEGSFPDPNNLCGFSLHCERNMSSESESLADTVVEETSYSERASDTVDINSLANSASQSIPCDVPHVN